MHNLTKKILVCGAGGFIGTHLVSSLKKQGHYVIGADIKYPAYSETDADEFYICDLSIWSEVDKLLDQNIDMIYQLAADMGGAGYIFTGENDANIMFNSLQINLNICKGMVKNKIKNIFYTSSACVYPEHLQLDSTQINLQEHLAYPADPDSEYGWEKLTSERLFSSFEKNYGFRVRIARLHNVFGPLGSFDNGLEKAPAAICRKVAQAKDTIEIWGTGKQVRSFLYIDECIKGIHLLQESNYNKPVNIGSETAITIDQLVDKVCAIAGKKLEKIHLPGPTGVDARCSNNLLINKVLQWSPDENLDYGLKITYDWIANELEQK